MERVYAAWTKGAKPEDVELIKKAMAVRPMTYQSGADNGRPHRRRYRHSPPDSLRAGTRLALEAPARGRRVPAPADEPTGVEHLSDCIAEEKDEKLDSEDLAGVEGFEPPYGGIKTRCLTAWRHPSV